MEFLHILYGPLYTIFHSLIIFIVILIFKKRLFACIFAIIMLLQKPIIEFFKNIYQSPRPPQEFFGVYEINSYSYPSGHAMVSMTITLFVIYFVFTTLKTGIKYLFSIIYLILAILSAYCRLYLDVHWFIDIIGGWFLVFSICPISIFLYKKLPIYYEKYKNNSKKTFNRYPASKGKAESKNKL
ncbi:MAG: phosphatase PAP2 family protein [Clostridiales bacterium]